MENVMESQVGGNHYTRLKMQPVEFIFKARLSFIQGSIVKYVSRYKYKNGKQDLEKCIHFSQLAIELCEVETQVPSVGLAYCYCKTNEMSALQTNIIVSVVKTDYHNVIRYCNQLIKNEYL